MTLDRVVKPQSVCHLDGRLEPVYGRFRCPVLRRFTA